MTTAAQLAEQGPKSMPRTSSVSPKNRKSITAGDPRLRLTSNGYRISRRRNYQIGIVALGPKPHQVSPAQKDADASGREE
jgi:hypothetical protein